MQERLVTMKMILVFSAILIAVVIIMLFAPAMAQVSSFALSTTTNQLDATPTWICPTLVPTITENPIHKCYRYQGEDSAGTEAKKSNAYCGQTCVAMAIQYVREENIPISEIARFVRKGIKDLTNAQDLKKALDNWQVESTPVEDMDTLRRAVQDRGHIVIAIINMPKMETQGQDYREGGTDPREHCDKYVDCNLGHWVVVHGITSDGRWVIVHDPDVFDGGKYWYSGHLPKGQNRYYRYSEFEAALDAINEDSLEILASYEYTVIENFRPQLLRPGEATRVSCTLQNTGMRWVPEHDYRLVNVNNLPFGAGPQNLEKVVHYGKTMTWTLDLVAPQEPGAYQTDWQIVHDNKPIGPVIPCYVIVASEWKGLPSYWPIIKQLAKERLSDIEQWFEERLDEVKQFFIDLLLGELGRLLGELARLWHEFWDSLLQQYCGANAVAPAALLLGAWGINHKRHRRTRDSDRNRPGS